MTSEAPAMRYELTEADLEELPVEHHHFDPAVRAAANLDPRVLKAILALGDPRYGPSTFDGCESALTAAIRAGLEQNVHRLLQAGADPNGLPRIAMSRWSARFLRFAPHLPISNLRTREELIQEIGRSQLDPLSEEEVLARRKTRLPFWAGQPLSVQNRLITPLMTALEAAVVAQNLDIINALLYAGVDTTAWTARHDIMSEDPTVSFLSTSTPLHRAIETGNTELVHHLLQRGFRADAFPLSAPTLCMNPLMFSLAMPDTDLTIYHLLAASPTTDHHRATPVFGIQSAHIAAATLSIPAIKAVAECVSLQAVGPTALGHSLLHIVCLPASDTSINHFSPKIHQSIHELRTLDAAYHPILLWPSPPPGPPRRGKPPFAQQQPAHGALPRQREAIAFLRDHHGIDDWTAQDVYGNTPLHYLAAHTAATADALEEVLSSADHAWALPNMWGHTPRDLLDDGRDALRRLAESGQTPESVVYMPHWRDPMGRWVMGRWVSSYPEDQ